MSRASSSSNRARCPICTESFPLDQLLVLHCGHGFCIKCTAVSTKTSSNDGERKCSVCRTPLAGIEPHRLYLDVEKQHPVIEGLNKIDMDAPAASVAKAGGKIEKLLKKADPELLQAVLDAKKEIEEKIAPLFEKWEQTRDENKVLLNKYKEAMSKVDKEKRRLIEVKKTIDAQQVEISQYKDRIKEYKACMLSRDEKITQLKDELELKDKQINLANKKLKILAKQDKKRRRRSQDGGDTSLQIEAASKVPTSSKRISENDNNALLDSDSSTVLQPVKRQKQSRT